MKTKLKKIVSIGLFGLITFFGYSQQVSTSNTSAPGTCDGTAVLLDSINVDPISIYWSGNGTVIQQGYYYIYGLCPGIYTVTYVNSLGVSQTVTFEILSGTSNPCSGFSATIFSVPSTDPTSCNGIIEVSVAGGTAPYTYSWNNSTLSGGAVLQNVCPGSYYCVITDANGCSYTVQTFVADSTGGTGNPCAGLTAVATTIPSTDGISCNGIIEVSVSGGTSPYSYSWNNSTTFGTSVITNACPGSYYCVVTDASGCTFTVQAFVVDSSNTGNPCDGFYASSSVYPSTDATSCDGMMIVSVIGGTSPYTYSTSAGTSTVSGNLMNLCPGIYTIVVVDANGCAFTVSGAIVDSSAYFPDSSNIIINPTYGDSAVVDTLDYSWIYDCTIDLGFVDSAYVIDNSMIGTDSVLVTWILIDPSGQILGTITIPYATGGVTGVVSVYLTIICPQHSPGDNALIAIDQIYLSSSSAGILAMEADQMNVLNPFDESLEISFEKSADRTILLYDLKGAVVYSEYSSSKEVNLDTRHVQKGMYILSVQEGAKVYQKKLIK